MNRAVPVPIVVAILTGFLFVTSYYGVSQYKTWNPEVDFFAGDPDSSV